MLAAADALRPFIRHLCGGDPPLRVRFWDGSELAPASAGDGATLVVASPRVLRRLLWQPNELGLARAYVAGELDIDGDIWSLFSLPALLSPGERPDGWRGRLEGGRELIAAARAVGALGPPLPPPPEEARLHGAVHSRARDARAIAHHYDVSNDFYRLFLGETMTYSCAYFATPQTALDDAQRAKYDLICRKLGLGPGSRLLDVGCGWGGMALHAAQHYGAQVVGVTLSRRQVEYARQAAAAAGLADHVDIRLQDYRDVRDEPYDAISSIGMFEHVGAARLAEYFACLSPPAAAGRPAAQPRHLPAARQPRPQPPLVRRPLRVPGWRTARGRHRRAGHAEPRLRGARHAVAARALCPHPAPLGRCPGGALGRGGHLAGAGRARVWRLYMAGSAENFARANLTIHQILAVRPRPGGASDMPLTRDAFLA